MIFDKYKMGLKSSPPMDIVPQFGHKDLSISFMWCKIESAFSNVPYLLWTFMKSLKNTMNSWSHPLVIHVAPR